LIAAALVAGFFICGRMGGMTDIHERLLVAANTLYNWRYRIAFIACLIALIVGSVVALMKPSTDGGSLEHEPRNNSPTAH